MSKVSDAIRAREQAKIRPPKPPKPKRVKPEPVVEEPAPAEPIEVVEQDG